MQRNKTLLLTVILTVVFWGNVAGQSQIYVEDFEDGTVGYISSISENTNGSDDYFIRTDGSNISASFTNIQGASFFAAQDIDGLGVDSEQTLTFNDINIAGYENLELRVYLAEDDASNSEEDWDDPDFLHFGYNIDNAESFSNLLWVEGEGGTNATPRIDTDFDGTGDGDEITDTFTQYIQSISGTGSTLDLKVIFDLDDGDTDIAIDNVEIWGTALGDTPTQLDITEVNGGSLPSAGTPFEVIVQAQDESGIASNVLSDVDVTLSLDSGTGGLGGNLTGTISNGNNQTTISGVTYNTAESGVAFTISDDASNLSPGTSSSFEVLEAATNLVFVDLPTHGVGGSPLSSFNVEAQRSDNSIDLNYSEDITVSIESGSGTIGGTVTKSAENGVAIFDDITIDDEGDHNLKATDGTIISSPSSTISLVEVNIVLNEFLADPDGDPNGDGNESSTEDEFIEFINTGNSDLDITGWTIEEEGGLAHTFPSTVLKPFQPVVVFSGGSADGYFGGAIVQISSEGGFILNNSGDSIILKNDSGIEIINYSYDGEAGYNQSVTRNPDLTGNFEDHTSADPGGSNFSPGLRIDNFSFLPVIQITGNEGWRMLSSPTADNSYDDLLDPIWTQGSETGANYAGGDPNVVIYDDSSFNAVDNLTSNMTTGQGFLVFVYEDDDFDPGTSDSFPKILEMSGTENMGPVTPSINEGTNDAATLVGNPFLSPIGWDLLAKNNLTETVYVYDHSYGTPADDDVSAAGVAGSYRTWSSSGTGSLTGGLIAPFQGFFVLYDGSGTASLTMEESDKTVGGTFYKNEIKQPVFIRLKAETERMFNEAFFSFNKSGRVGIDNFDGFELTPLDHADYLSLATESEGTLLDINNLPLEISETIEVPLHVNAYQAIEEGWKTTSSKVTLSWPELQNIPSDWTVTLVDTQREMQINLKETESYTFLVEGNVSKFTGKKPFHLSLKNPIQLEKSPQGNRFILSIDPASETSLNDIPDQFSLKQNYPNPFNPVTNIRYEIARSTRVELNVYNVMGQQIATLVNETKAPGAYEVTWDASDMASGIYYYQLNVNGIVFTRQMALIK